ncbi:hypothetical protein ACE3NQ_14230 [Paenibacillus terreus]|uniref:DUF4367 domain-containing protein n=1 Tax=Paenibacillus terreus TaxID=1387834 RepID=A0ABV5B9B0_9BACL
MKKKIAVAGLTGALLLTGGGLMYQTYAAEADSTTTIDTPSDTVGNVSEDEATSISVQPEERIEPDPNAQQFGVDLSEVPEGELRIPEDIKEPSAAVSINSEQSSVVPDLKQTNLFAQDFGDGLQFKATYQSQNGTEFLVSQNPLLTDEDGTIQAIKEFYNEPVGETEISGHQAAYVDGKERKVVHFFVKNHGFSVSTFNGSLDDALNVAKQILEQIAE